MKTFNWSKLPSASIMGKKNIWSLLAKKKNSIGSEMNYDDMENLFCLNKNMPGNTSKEDEKIKKRDNEVILFDGKRNLHINIFIKQFKR